MGRQSRNAKFQIQDSRRWLQEKFARKARNYDLALQTYLSRSAALLTDRLRVPRAYETGPRFAGVVTGADVTSTVVSSKPGIA